MGRPKLLLPWGKSSMLEHSIQQWSGLPASQIGVVCAARPGPVHDELDRIHFPESNRIINLVPERGMFSSIGCAAAWNGWNAKIRHWVISLGDQPHVGGETLRALVDFATANPDKICQPLRDSRRRHPVLLNEAAFRALKGCSFSNFKEFLESRSSELAGFESDDAGLDFDIDTPEDYERARQFHFV
jgi:CTP:molybdopterin cytidylyltransferase MocA